MLLIALPGARSSVGAAAGTLPESACASTAAAESIDDRRNNSNATFAILDATGGDPRKRERPRPERDRRSETVTT